jgi:hypothetical protein
MRVEPCDYDSTPVLGYGLYFIVKEDTIMADKKMHTLRTRTVKGPIGTLRAYPGASRKALVSRGKTGHRPRTERLLTILIRRSIHPDIQTKIETEMSKICREP